MAQINNKEGNNNMHKDVRWLNFIALVLLTLIMLVCTKNAVAGPLLYDVRYNPLLEGEVM